MKRLVLIRHAQAAWGDQKISDRERPLSRDGELDARLLGVAFHDHHPEPVDLIISSPARRAVQTAQIIAQTIGLEEQKIELCDVIYGSSVEALLDFISYVDDSIDVLMLIGHNPHLTSLANSFCPSSIETIPPASGVVLDFDVDSWSKLPAKKAIAYLMIKPRNC